MTKYKIYKKEKQEETFIGMDLTDYKSDLTTFTKTFYNGLYNEIQEYQNKIWQACYIPQQYLKTNSNFREQYLNSCVDIYKWALKWKENDTLNDKVIKNEYKIYSPYHNEKQIFKPYSFQKSVINFIENNKYSVFMKSRQVGFSTLMSAIADVYDQEDKKVIYVTPTEAIAKNLSRELYKDINVVSFHNLDRSIRGMRADLIIFDEIFYSNEQSSDIERKLCYAKSVLKPEGKMVIGNSNCDKFIGFWNYVLYQDTEYSPMNIPWQAISRKDNFKRDLIDILGEEVFNSEYRCE